LKFEGINESKSSEPSAIAFGDSSFFSFTLGGKSSTELLKTWDCKRTSRKLDANRTEYTITYTDASTGLVLRCVGIAYQDFPTVEWTLYFKNTGDKDTPILENVQPLDATLSNLPPQGEYCIHQSLGSSGKQTDYQPIDAILEVGKTHRQSAGSGRTSNGIMPYFNVEMPNQQGVIVVVGWPGLWNATFTRENDKQLRMRAYQEISHFKLLPGEEVRTPLVVLQFWKGNLAHSQNIWRRWMMEHNLPRPGGKLPSPILTASSSRAYEEMAHANEENQIMHIDRYLEEGFKIDYWWMDAGWYITSGGWPAVGTWEVDPQRFPHGFKPISDHAHAKGVKVLLWFEPERVTPNTWLTNNHPDWILGGANGGLLNLGNPDAWNWLVNHIDKLITEQGIDLYRQDFNMDPLPLWQAADAPDRQGITENKHITGYLAYWDELLRRHPNMLIDTCASGGGRLDLETLRRSVPLWRSDYAYEPIGHQGMTHSLSQWLPYHGTGTVACTSAAYYGGGTSPVEPYAFWSNAAPALGFGIDIREKGLDYAALRRLVEQRNQITSYYYGDFYPLTKYTLDKNAWIAWQFDCPESGKGMIQAFRRDECPNESLQVKLQGLDPDATYAVTNLDVPGSQEFKGRELMETGIPVTLKAKPAAAVITYQRTGK
jgi:alpha-galactosidase